LTLNVTISSASSDILKIGSVFFWQTTARWASGYARRSSANAGSAQTASPISSGLKTRIRGRSGKRKGIHTEGGVCANASYARW